MKKAYDLRLRVIHGGSVSETDLNSHATYVRSILGALIVRIIKMGEFQTISDLNYLLLVGEIESP